MNMASTETVVCLLMLAFGTRGASSAAGKSYSALSSSSSLSYVAVHLSQKWDTGGEGS